MISVTALESVKKVNIICPYCKHNFQKDIEGGNNSTKLLSILIKDHPNSQDCGPFIAFIDKNGSHRGSQKIDNVDEVDSEKSKVIEDARSRIEEMDDKLRFYHLKIPPEKGRAFDHKVAKVSDRSFMSSAFYMYLIQYLLNCEAESTFGMICLNDHKDLDGILVYGKYLGILYTMYWKDQISIKQKSWDDLKGYTNLAVEKLLDFYDLIDLLF
ncbi:MAG: hypothetical protein BAJALOKI3v1_1000006 [Promethearchaeota archaeon]|nr:MAG: hypothetical protein BAJALOKI3v1_1000006 [Candidatus Lokiarchaeota archaeon]